MSTLLPEDDNNNPAPALRYRNDESGAAMTFERVGEAEGVANVIEFDGNTEFFSLSTDGKIKILLGDENVEADASAHGLHAGHYEFIPIANPATGEQEFTHLSIYFVDAATVYVSERH